MNVPWPPKTFLSCLISLRTHFVLTIECLFWFFIETLSFFPEHTHLHSAYISFYCWFSSLPYFSSRKTVGVIITNIFSPHIVNKNMNFYVLILKRLWFCMSLPPKIKINYFIIYHLLLGLGSECPRSHSYSWTVVSCSLRNSQRLLEY